MLQLRATTEPDGISDRLLREERKLYVETYRELPIRTFTHHTERMANFLERVDASKRELPIAMYDGRRSTLEPISLYVFVRPSQGADEILEILSQELLDDLGNAILRAGQVVLMADSQEHALELISLAPTFQRVRFPVPVVRRWPGEAEIEYGLYKPQNADESAEQVESSDTTPTLNILVATNDAQPQSITTCA